MSVGQLLNDPLRRMGFTTNRHPQWTPTCKLLYPKHKTRHPSWSPNIYMCPINGPLHARRHTQNARLIIPRVQLFTWSQSMDPNMQAVIAKKQISSSSSSLSMATSRPTLRQREVAKPECMTYQQVKNGSGLC